MADLFSLPMEMLVVGTLLIDNGAFREVSEEVSAEDFYSPLCRELFKEVLSGRAEGRMVSLSTLHHDFVEGGKFAHHGGSAVLRAFGEHASIAKDALACARDIRKLAERRAIVDLAEATRIDAERERDPDITLERLSAKLAARSTVRINSEFLPKAASLATDDLLEPGAMGKRVSTGWQSLDKLMAGWPRGKMSMIAARPSMGKSMFAVNAARRVADQGMGTAIISMEMADTEIWLRMAADIAFRKHAISPDLSSPAYSDVRDGKVTESQREMMREALAKVRSLPLVVDDRSALKVSQIAKFLRKLDQVYRDQGGRLDAVFVDYLQLCRPSQDRKGNKVQEVTDISGDLVALAKDMDIALIALSQLSRAPEQRGNPRPTLSDLRDSGSLEQDADVVAMLFRPAYYFERRAKEEALTDKELAEQEATKNVLEIDFQKNRNGKTGMVKMYTAPGANAVRDLAPAFREVAA